MELDIIKSLLNVESASRGSSLVTLYVPANSNIWLVKDQIKQELKTASNIKNKTVSKEISEALHSISNALKTIVQIPVNGTVLLSGNYYSKSSILTDQCS